MKSIKGVIWDVDGTLADTLGLCVTSLQTAIESVAGPSLSEDEVKATFGPTEEGILEGLVGDRWEDAFDIYLEMYEKAHDAEALVFSDVVEEVRRLADAGIPQSVVTGKGMASAEITLTHIGAEGAFDQVAAGSDKGSVKAVEIARITHEWGFDPNEVVYIGDHDSDVTHARKAGAVAVSAAWAPGTDVEAIELVEPDAILFNADQLAHWLNAHIAGLTS